jgi:hypothetical protein
MTQRQLILLWVSFALAFPASGVVLGCEQGTEGDRCNPDLVDTTECNSGLRCVTPSSCVVSVCCPVAPPYSDPQCECFAHPERCACDVDAAYDAGVSAKERVDSERDASDE